MMVVWLCPLVWVSREGVHGEGAHPQHQHFAMLMGVLWSEILDLRS